ncbi:MAG: isopeptide-forming domain-containing fimbrial protein, partial [Cyanobacteria bacterium P01_F01_bin.13]
MKGIYQNLVTSFQTFIEGQKTTNPHRPSQSDWAFHLLSRGLTSLGITSLMLLIAVPKADAEVTRFRLDVRSDGSAPFVGPDPTYPGTSDAGNDADVTNGIVRTYDTVVYRVGYATDTQPNDDTLMTVTITDDYHLWDENQAACIGSVVVSRDRKTLTCSETLPTSTTGFFDFTTTVLGTAPHGTDLQVEATLTIDDEDDGDDSLTAGPTNTKVSATPKMDLVKDRPANPLRDGTFTMGPNGEEGVLYVWPLSVVAPKGSEMLGDADLTTPGNQIVITDVVSGISPNARLYTWGGRAGCSPNVKDQAIAGEWIRELPYGALSLAEPGEENRAVADSGTWSCSQTGGAGTDITIIITDADLSGQHRPTVAANGNTLNVDDTYLIAGVVEIWIPTSDFPAGGDQLTVTNYYEFLDTPSISNQPNTEPDQNGQTSIPLSDSDTVNNDRQFVLQRPLPGRTQRKYYRTPYAGGNFRNNELLYPMTEIESGDGVVLPGQIFGSYFTMKNNGSENLTNVMLCDKFDNRTQILAPHPTTNRYVEMRSGSERLNASEVMIEYGVGGDNATDSYYGAETAAIDDVARYDAQRSATCDDSDATWYTETDLANDPTLIPQVSRVRVRPTAANGALPEGYSISTVVNLQALNIDPITGTQIPDPIILANFGISRVDEINNGQWRSGNYRPEDHSGNNNGDRLRLTRAVVRIDKSTDDPNNATEADDTINVVKATDNITFALESTLTALVNEAPWANIVVTDTLPQELTYVSGSANIAPDSVTENGDGTTTLVWDLGNHVPNVPIPTITFQAKAGFDVVGGTNAINTASVAALDAVGDDLDTSPITSRSDSRSVTISNNAAFTIFKEAVLAEIEPGDDIVYDLYLANLSEDIDVLAGSEFISILPFEGDSTIRDPFDGAGTPPTDYTAVPTFKTIEDVDNAGFTFQFTNDTPSNISDNPATQSGSTVWCNPAQITSSVAGCPATDYSDVTAVLIIAPAMNVGGPTRRLQLTLGSTGSLGNDIYTNNFKGTPNHPSLGFIPSVDATVRTRDTGIVSGCIPGGGTADANIARYISDEVRGNNSTTRNIVDTLDDSWRTAVGLPLMGTVEPWFGAAQSLSNNEPNLFTYTLDGQAISVGVALVNIDANSDCIGTVHTGSTAELNDRNTLQDNAPRPASLYDDGIGAGNGHPAMWNENVGATDGPNGVLFTFSEPVRAFGAWFGDIETRTDGNGVAAYLRLLDGSGDRIGADIAIEPTNLIERGGTTVINQSNCGSTATDIGCGNRSTRWISFIDSAATPRVTQMLLIVGDDDEGGNAGTEHISFIGANVLQASDPNVLLVKRIT